jgi:hypothetical protein
MQRWGLFWQILSVFKSWPQCTSDRLYTGMYYWTFSERYCKAVMLVRLYMRPIIFIDMRFIPICTVGPVFMGHARYFQWSNCTQPNQPVKKVLNEPSIERHKSLILKVLKFFEILYISCIIVILCIGMYWTLEKISFQV